jgi:YihY family inner membrane protein
VIGAVGIASALGTGTWSSAIVHVLQSLSPGPSGRVLTEAVGQAHEAGSSGEWVAIAIGTVGALITGTTLMGQVERALNRLYGVETDRSTAAKYGHAFLLTISAGLLMAVAFIGLAMGSTIASAIGGETARTIWNVLRWPIGVALLVAGTALIFRYAPRRHQPSWSWLSFGAIISVALLALVTIAMNLFFAFSASFGDTYGPLAGLVALAFWGFFSSVALLTGAAFAAQLEAVRAGEAEPRSAQKIERSEPGRLNPLGVQVVEPAS